MLIDQHHHAWENISTTINPGMINRMSRSKDGHAGNDRNSNRRGEQWAGGEQIGKTSLVRHAPFSDMYVKIPSAARMHDAENMLIMLFSTLNATVLGLTTVCRPNPTITPTTTLDKEADKNHSDAGPQIAL